MNTQPQNNKMYNELTFPQRAYVDSIRNIGKQWGYDLTKTDWTRRELVAISMKRQGNDDVPNWIVKDQSRRVGRGVYSIPELPLLEAVSPGQGIEGDDLADSAPLADEQTTHRDRLTIEAH